MFYLMPFLFVFSFHIVIKFSCQSPNILRYAFLEQYHISITANEFKAYAYV